jgi:hypothetical protein
MIVNYDKADFSDTENTKLLNIPKKINGFNGTLFITVIDKLICQNCTKSLSAGYLCNYTAWRWRIMCGNCRWLHKRFEKRFMAFQMISNNIQHELASLEKIEREEKASKMYSVPHSVFD